MLRRFVASASAIIVLVVAGSGVSALSTSQDGHWSMNENPVSSSSSVLDNVGGNNGLTSSNSTISSVASISPNSTGAFFFPGWTQLINGSVDPTASSYTIPNTSDDRYNPGTSDFTVSFWVNALDPSALVQNGTILKNDTLNIIQKNRDGKDPITKLPRQQWKVSILPAGKFICTYLGPNASGVVTHYDVKSKAYPFGVSRFIACSLSNGQITLEVGGSSSSVDTFTGPGPVSVSSTADVTVGKKPDTTYPGDTFAGTLDDLTISKGN